MRILIVHSSYRVSGGEDRYVAQQADLLADGHEVEVLSSENEGLRATFSTAQRMLFSPERISDVDRTLRRFRPDVVHVHNVYPGFGPAVHLATARAGVPLVMTVHNHRMRCPNGLMFTEGRNCRRCEGGVYAHAVLHDCFSTKAQAGAYALSLWAHRFALRLEEKVDLFIAPSVFLRDQLERWGIDRERIRLIRHPIDVSMPAAAAVGDFGMYIGRLSPEKGLGELLLALELAGDPSFEIVGDGPERIRLERLAEDIGLKRLRFAGRVAHDQVRPLLERARFVAVPSLCHEVASLAASEAMAAGRPLLATRTGGLPELVGRARGVVCEPGDVVDMGKKIRRLMTDDDLCRSAGLASSTFAREHLTPTRHRTGLEEAYAAVVASFRPKVEAGRGDAG